VAPERERPEHILVVDDDEGSRRVMARLLHRAGFVCITAGSLTEAKERMAEEEFALVLTDVNMPGGSGLDLLMGIGESDVATVMVSGADDPRLAATALDLGAYGYMIKPFESSELLITVDSALRRRRAEIENKTARQRLEQMVQDRTQEMIGYIAQLEDAEQKMRQLQEETIQRLSLAAEFRDDDTPRHVQRMSRYSSLIAERAGLDPEHCETVRVASSMHDVGKIGIPDHILMKPGKLSPEEWAIMQRHCEIGHRLLSGTDIEVLNLAATIAWTHHERVDGTGYPRGLKGEDIPIEGRIAAIADVFDALTSNRVYSKARPFNEAVELMRQGSGTQFDDLLLDSFLSSMGLILGIKERYADAAPVEGEGASILENLREGLR
jgi:putative two-component system response regulator